MELRHVTSAACFERPFIEGLLDSAAALDQALTNGTPVPNHAGRTIKTLFIERSTRTRNSFELAAHLLGANVISTENAKESSSIGKGESYEDTIRVLGGWPLDALVIRSDQPGLFELADFSAKVPIISAGDGGGEHPTQALVDLYTIRKELGRLDGLLVVVNGDLKSRAVRSLVLAGSAFDIHFRLFGPPSRHLEDAVMSFVQTRHNALNVPAQNQVDGPDLWFWQRVHDREAAFREADVVVLARFQSERDDPGCVLSKCTREDFFFGMKELKLLKDDAIVMHPLPKPANEVDPALTPEFDHRIAWFRQSDNGVPVRMALLHWVFTGEFYKPDPYKLDPGL